MRRVLSELRPPAFPRHSLSLSNDERINMGEVGHLYGVTILALVVNAIVFGLRILIRVRHEGAFGYDDIAPGVSFVGLMPRPINRYQRLSLCLMCLTLRLRILSSVPSRLYTCEMYHRSAFLFSKDRRPKRYVLTTYWFHAYPYF